MGSGSSSKTKYKEEAAAGVEAQESSPKGLNENEEIVQNENEEIVQQSTGASLTDLSEAEFSTAVTDRGKRRASTDGDLQAAMDTTERKGSMALDGAESKSSRSQRASMSMQGSMSLLENGKAIVGEERREGKMRRASSEKLLVDTDLSPKSGGSRRAKAFLFPVDTDLQNTDNSRRASASLSPLDTDLSPNAASRQRVGRKSVLEGLEPDSPLLRGLDTPSPTSKGSRGGDGYHHHHKHRGSFMGADSLEILHKKSEARSKEDDGLCGFKVGDKITTRDGADARGPWERLGEGTVIGRSHKKGCIEVKYGGTGNTWELKAANLTNLTNFSRSGQHILDSKKGEEIIIIKKRASIWDTPEAAALQADPSRGLKPGDHVGLSRGGQGICVKINPEHGDQMLVNFGDLGIRSIPVCQLTKTRITDEQREEDARKATEVSRNRKRFTLSLTEALNFDEQNFNDAALAKTL
jgi:hypothetical protein